MECCWPNGSIIIGDFNTLMSLKLSVAILFIIVLLEVVLVVAFIELTCFGTDFVGTTLIIILELVGLMSLIILEVGVLT